MLLNKSSTVWPGANDWAGRGAGGGALSGGSDEAAGGVAECRTGGGGVYGCWNGGGMRCGEGGYGPALLGKP